MAKLSVAMDESYRPILMLLDEARPSSPRKSAQSVWRSRSTTTAHQRLFYRFPGREGQAMHIHAIHDRLLLKNVRVEVVYEESPIAADEEVSAIIRFRHYGVPKQPVTVEEANEETSAEANGTAESSGNGVAHEQIGEEGGWFGKRLSLQLSSTARALFLEELDKKPDWRNQPVDLLMGYAQLSGIMTYDPSVIDHTKVDDIRRRAAISGKIGGLDGLEVSKTEEGLFSKLSWGISGIMNAEMDNLKLEDTKKPTQNTDNVVPFFSTPKSLLFSEIKLKDGETPVFYLKCKLPKALPPSYEGNSLKIQYHLIVGASLDEQIPKPMNLTFPLTVSSHFDQSGYQPIPALDQFILLSPNNIVNESVSSKSGSSSSARRASFKTIKNTILTQPKLSQSTKKDKFLTKLRQMSADEVEDGTTVDDFKSTKVRDNVLIFTESLIGKGEINEDEPKLIKIEGYTYEKQVSKLQTQYIISRNGKSITTLSFSKPLYKVGETIKLSLDLKNKELKATGCLITLESLELLRDAFALNPDEAKSQPSTVTHFKESFQLYSHDTLPVNIPIPLSSTGQFKTNMFEVRWCINLKFILTEEDLQHEIHDNPTGKLYSAKESVSGYEFNCRLPITVLPCDKIFGGITV